MTALALPVSIDISTQGVLLSLVNVPVWPTSMCGVVLCRQIRRSRNGGTLLVRNEMALGDVFTLPIPAALRSGQAHLVLTWYKENNLLLCNAVGKPKKIDPLEIRTYAVSETMEIDLVASAVPEHLSRGSTCVLRMYVCIGETRYVGTFLFGTAV